MAEIYGLYSGRDGKVRYVGQTFRTRHDRIKEHQRVGSDHVIRPVYQWIQREWEAGFPVETALLEVCSDEVVNDVERNWISRFPRLLNESKLGDHWRYCAPPVISDIKEYMSRFIFNCGAIAAFITGVN